MSLTQAQWTALKNDIIAATDAECVALEADPTHPDKAHAVMLLYNQTVAPDFWVWKNSLSEWEVTQTTSVDDTTFTWVGNGFITRAAGEQAAWGRLFTIGVNPALPSVRQAFNDILSGSGNAAANRTHLLVVARRKATRAEKLFAVASAAPPTPSGTLGSTTAVATAVLYGSLSVEDILQAMDKG